MAQARKPAKKFWTLLFFVVGLIWGVAVWNKE